MNLRKLLKQLPVGFAEEADAMGPDDARAAIIQAETRIQETERAKENDENLEALREKMQDLNGSYADAVKAQRAKIKYLLMKLEQSGELIESDD